MKEEVDATHAEGKYVSAGIGHQYESAWQMLGPEENRRREDVD